MILQSSNFSNSIERIGTIGSLLDRGGSGRSWKRLSDQELER